VKTKTKNKLPPATHRQETQWPPSGEIEVSFAESYQGRTPGDTVVNHTVSVAVTPTVLGYLLNALDAFRLGVSYIAPTRGAKRGDYGLVRYYASHLDAFKRYAAMLETTPAWPTLKKGFRALLGLLAIKENGYLLIRTNDVKHVWSLADTLPPVPGVKDFQAKRLKESTERLMKAELEAPAQDYCVADTVPYTEFELEQRELLKQVVNEDEYPSQD